METMASNKKKFWDKCLGYKYLIIMLSPILIYYFIFSYLPMFGVLLAFKNYDYSSGILKSPWVGLENFKFFFKSGKALLVTKNTFFYNIVFIFTNKSLQLLVAIMLSEINNRYFKKISQTLMLFPYFISWIIVSIFCYNLFNVKYGFVNALISNMGMEKINFYARPDIWKYLLVILNAWKGLGYGSIIYLAAITSIDSSYYEAAKIDGANVFQRIRFITIPCLVPTIIITVLLSLGGAFKGQFGMFYPLVGSSGMLQKTTEVIDTLTYRALMQTGDIGMSSAVGLYQSVLCFVFILITNGIIKKIEPDSALF